MKPQRVQIRRVKGWRMPPNTVYVGRPTRWGNPYRVGQAVGPGSHAMTAAEAVMSYSCYIIANKQSAERFRLPLEELRGKNLACWCSLDSPCHADVLLRMANAEEEP